MERMVKDDALGQAQFEIELIVLVEFEHEKVISSLSLSNRWIHADLNTRNANHQSLARVPHHKVHMPTVLVWQEE